VLTRIEVISEEPGVPDLPLGGFVPNNEAIQIRNIEGLGPVKSDIATTGYATGRGEISTGQSTPKRNIVLTLGLNPSWVDQSPASLRQLLYHYFMPSTRPHLTFFTDELPDVYIDGIVESFEPNIFSQDPEIQVSILCLRPDFIDTGSTFLTGTVDDGATGTAINYPGSIPVGFQLQIKPSTACPEYTGDLIIANTVRGIQQIFGLSDVTIDSENYVWIDSTKTLRFVHNIRTSDDLATDMLAKIEPDSEWPEFKPGPNTLSVAADAPGFGLTWTLGYINRFGGL
jgi:hypothetical protein